MSLFAAIFYSSLFKIKSLVDQGSTWTFSLFKGRLGKVLKILLGSYISEGLESFQAIWDRMEVDSILGGHITHFQKMVCI